VGGAICQSSICFRFKYRLKRARHTSLHHYALIVGWPKKLRILSNILDSPEILDLVTCMKYDSLTLIEFYFMHETTALAKSTKLAMSELKTRIETDNIHF